MLLQQKSMQINNNLTEQQVNNNSKAKTKQNKTTNTRTIHFTTIQSYKTYDFGSYENCEQKVKLSELSLTSYHQFAQ